VIPRRIFRLGALMVWPAAQQLVESIVAGVLNGQVSAES